MSKTQTIVRRSRSAFPTGALCLSVAAVFWASGCVKGPRAIEKSIGNDTADIDRISASVDAPQAEIYPESGSQPPITAVSVRDLASYGYRDMTLTEVVQMAMQHSQVLRELGGTVLRNPDAIRTRYTQRLQNTDPRFSREAALSAFDAQFRAAAAWNSNDRIFNNSFFAGGTTGFQQDLDDYSAAVTKNTATGAQMAIRSILNYDRNNAPANTFNSVWNAWVEGEVRQPLLQGGGLEFNRIAGPNAVPGVYNGLLIARVNSDITDAAFEIALRDFVSNVENAYWDLYYAYRDVAARRKAVLKAKEVWQVRDERDRKNLEKKPAELALAREQYYRFKADLDESISGRLVQGTQSRNGSTGGTLRGNGGLLVAERKLRLLIGLPTSDGSLLRPADEPTLAEVMFDWHSVRSEAMNQRTELRQQQLRVRRREMELLAAQNFLNPRLDAFARYRLRGFGDNLQQEGNNSGSNSVSALGNLATGDLQEWAAGFEVTVPIGFRQAHAAVSNAELRVARERAVHREQQREVVHDLGNAVSDVARAYQSAKNNLNRYLASEEALQALTVNDKETGRVEVDRILDAQRRAVEAELRYFRSRAEYAVALKNVHFEKGSLMEFNNLRIAGGSIPNETAPVYSNPPVETPSLAPPMPVQDPEAPQATPMPTTPEVAPEAPVGRRPQSPVTPAPVANRRQPPETPVRTVSQPRVTPRAGVASVPRNGAMTPLRQPGTLEKPAANSGPEGAPTSSTNPQSEGRATIPKNGAMTPIGGPTKTPR